MAALQLNDATMVLVVLVLQDLHVLLMEVGGLASVGRGVGTTPLLTLFARPIRRWCTDHEALVGASEVAAHLFELLVDLRFVDLGEAPEAIATTKRI